MGQVFDISPLCTDKRFKTGSGTLVDVSGYEARWLHKIQFASILSRELEWLGFSGAAGSASGGEVVVVHLLVWNESKLFFEDNARLTRDFSATKP